MSATFDRPLILEAMASLQTGTHDDDRTTFMMPPRAKRILDPATVLDQTTLSTILAALDAAHADDAGAARGRRVELDEVFATPANP